MNGEAFEIEHKLDCGALGFQDCHITGSVTERGAHLEAHILGAWVYLDKSEAERAREPGGYPYVRKCVLTLLDQGSRLDIREKLEARYVKYTRERDAEALFDYDGPKGAA
jgi:hypothetical protein